MSVHAVAHTAPPPPVQHAPVEAAKPAPVKTETHAAVTETRGNKVNKTA
jgi:hypothetical protein